MEDSRNSPLLEVRDLRTQFQTDAGTIPAVDGVSWTLRRGETLALVGESGCGKSATALSIMRLIPDPPGRIAGGEVVFADGPDDRPCDVLSVTQDQLRRLRGRRIAMIFQDPMSALNPVFTIGDQIAEAVQWHRRVKRSDAIRIAVDMLEKVGISAPAQRARAYPHQLSGGMQQRAMIAMALSCQPSLLIADEPTTALDVTVQAQVLELLRRMQAESGMGILFITHDLGVVAQIADRVCVMYAGRIVEQATVDVLFRDALHPYTQGLLRSLPRMDARRGRFEVIRGSVPDPPALPAGCRFHPRCDLTRRRSADGHRPKETVRDEGATFEVLARCVRNGGEEPGGVPDLCDVRPGHAVACWEVPTDPPSETR